MLVQKRGRPSRKEDSHVLRIATLRCCPRGPVACCVESLGELSAARVLAQNSRVVFGLRLDKECFLGFELESRTGLGLVAGILEELLASQFSEWELGMEARGGAGCLA